MCITILWLVVHHRCSCSIFSKHEDISRAAETDLHLKLEQQQSQLNDQLTTLEAQHAASTSAATKSHQDELQQLERSLKNDHQVKVHNQVGYMCII